MHVQLKCEPWIHKLIYRVLSQGPSSLQLSQDFLFPYVSPFWSSSQQLGSYLCLSFSVVNFCNWAHLLAQEMEDRERKRLTQIHPTLLELQLQQMHKICSLPSEFWLLRFCHLPQDFLGFGAWEEQQKKKIADEKKEGALYSLWELGVTFSDPWDSTRGVLELSMSPYPLLCFHLCWVQTRR